MTSILFERQKVCPRDGNEKVKHFHFHPLKVPQCFSSPCVISDIIGYIETPRANENDQFFIPEHFRLHQAQIINYLKLSKIWGIGLKDSDPDINNPNKWKGRNLPGFTLMEVRDVLRSELQIEYVSFV